jgi:YD repeat-containing protein
MIKLHGERDRGVRVMLALALASSCVPGVKGTTDVPTGGGGEVSQPDPGGPRGPSGPPPSFGMPVSSVQKAKPVIGGTLLALPDARTAVAADPDRDHIYFADYRKQAVLADIELQPGDEPGRLVADGEGRVHVALRGSGALLTLESTGGWHVAGRRPVCTAPRGVAYDADQRQIHVACADGHLVSLPVEPDAAPARVLELDRDLRDVVVDGDALLVSRFRSAEVLTIDRAGKVLRRQVPGARRTFRTVTTTNGNVSQGSSQEALMTPSVAWKMVPLRLGETLVLHQRGLADEVSETPGGYSGQDCGGIIESTVSRVGPLGDPTAAPTLPAGTLAVDLAVSPDGTQVAIVSPGVAKASAAGGFRSFGQVTTLGTEFLYQQAGECNNQGVGGSTGSVGFPDAGPVGDTESPPSGDGGVTDGGADDELPPPIDFRQPRGEAVAVVYDARGHLLVQTREPASIQLVTADRTVILSHDSRADTGHDIFHSDAGGGIACASCHPEGGDDGRTWKFRNKKGVLEVRRTQNLRGGVMGTAPFHWNGDLKDMSTLMDEVFVERMRGPKLGADYVTTLHNWIDTIPALPKIPVRDAAAVERGRALYGAAGCASCHNGALLTNNTTVDVGTGRPLQVPSLRGVVWRAPFMHDGCAGNLAARFDASCGGGDKHGVTSKLTAAQIADLVAFVETL